MRSLFIEYPRGEENENILADLFSLKQVYLNITLPVVNMHAHGIEVKFPTWLTGIFYLKIQDGEHSFLKRVAIQ
jgi:hypothetical protein